MVLVADVAGDFEANKAFWTEQCKQVPAGALAVELQIGTVVDYFRPVQGASWCQMLTSSDKHEWSPDGQGNWRKPAYSDYLGGSLINWPRDNVVGDQRAYLTIWGLQISTVRNGGCCSTSLDVYSVGWFPPLPCACETLMSEFVCRLGAAIQDVGDLWLCNTVSSWYSKQSTWTVGCCCMCRMQCWELCQCSWVSKLQRVLCRLFLPCWCIRGDCL